MTFLEMLPTEVKTFWTNIFRFWGEAGGRGGGGLMNQEFNLSVISHHVLLK